MNALNKIGGALLAAILVIAVISGLQTGTGRTAGTSVLNAAKAVLAWIGDHITRLLFVALMLLVPATRNGRGFAVSALICLVVALLLFQPSIGTSLRNAVSMSPAGTMLVR